MNDAHKLVILLLFITVAFFIGRASKKCTIIEPMNGTISSENVTSGMTEEEPDTVYVPVPGPERIKYLPEKKPTASIPDLVPIENIEPGPERDKAIDAALIDWNTMRTYKGTLFDELNIGKVTYDFDIQFNSVGPISWEFTPAQTIPASKKKRWGVGPYIGYGVSVQNGKLIGVPTVGISLHYSIIQW